MVRIKKSKTKPKHYVVVGGGPMVTVRGKASAKRIKKLRVGLTKEQRSQRRYIRRSISN